MKLFDQHMHSSFSRDSKEDLRNYYIEATKSGVSYVNTCEHFDFDTTISGETWDVDYDKLIEYQKKLHQEFPNITPLLGLELGYRKDYLDEMMEIANKYPFDLIQLSIHDSGKIDYYFDNAFDEGIDKVLNEYFDIMYMAVSTWDKFNVLSHIDYAYKSAKRLDNSLLFSKYEDKVVKIMQVLIEKGKALEINVKVQEPINSIEHTNYLLRLYKSIGGEKLTLSSDSHEVKFYRYKFDKYLKIIKDNGFKYVCYYLKQKEYHYDLD